MTLLDIEPFTVYVDPEPSSSGAGSTAAVARGLAPPAGDYVASCEGNVPMRLRVRVPRTAPREAVVLLEFEDAFTVTTTRLALTFRAVELA